MRAADPSRFDATLIQRSRAPLKTGRNSSTTARKARISSGFVRKARAPGGQHLCAVGGYGVGAEHDHGNRRSRSPSARSRRKSSSPRTSGRRCSRDQCRMQPPRHLQAKRPGGRGEKLHARVAVDDVRDEPQIGVVILDAEKLARGREGGGVLADAPPGRKPRRRLRSAKREVHPEGAAFLPARSRSRCARPSAR